MSNTQKEPNSHVLESQLENAVAVIGIASKFPGAEDYHQFWSNLENGINSISEVPGQRWKIDEFYSTDSQAPNKTNSKWGGTLTGIDLFDAQFFNLSPREVERMDPLQRMSLELSWSCIEDAGYSPLDLSGREIGVFVGACNYDTILRFNQDEIRGHNGTGTWTCMIPNRISYFFNFRGPSVPVDTACSSSLVAIHQAVNSIRHKECEMALVGGIHVLCSSVTYIQMSKLGMLSPQGQCRTFDSEADGYVRGEGAGIILLKPLAKAIQDKDHIYGVIKGTAINHGGRARTLTSPNLYAQAQVLVNAYKDGKVAPNTISYIEAHGTGTPLGDPIEINGLKRAFKQLYKKYNLPSQNQPHCGLGAVKTNIGHLEGASGIAGIIKVLLAMKHKKLPKVINFKQLNPRIKLKNSPFYIIEETQEWQKLKTETGKDIPRRAGISCFGIGGVNAHVVLEEAPESAMSAQTTSERPLEILTITAKTQEALRDLAQNYQDFLRSPESESLTDICFTANTGRTHFKHRLAVAGVSHSELAEKLQSFLAGNQPSGLITGKAKEESPKIAFLCPGQGSQSVDMGKQLYQTQPTFRQAIDECDHLLRAELEQPLLSVLYPENQDNQVINQTGYTQPALFAVEYALAQMWLSWGIKPDVVVGHSLGEYVAATLAGVFSLPEALKLVTYRGRLMEQLPPNSEMRAVMASAQILAEFREIASQINYQPPQIELISNLTGDVVDTEITSPEYWCNHIRHTVQFPPEIERLAEKGDELFVEIGAKPVLLGMAPQAVPEHQAKCLPSLCPGKEDWQQILETLAELYVAGVEVDWASFEANYPHQRIALPTYAFQRQSYWPGEATVTKQSQSKSSTYSHQSTSITQLLDSGEVQQLAKLLTQTTNLSETVTNLTPVLDALIKAHQQQLNSLSIDGILYQLKWQQQERKNQANTTIDLAPGKWLIFADSNGLGEAIANLMQQQKKPYIMVHNGQYYQQLDGNTWRINPGNPEHLKRMFKEALYPLQLDLQGIIHLWSLETILASDLTNTSLATAQDLTCASVLHLLQQLPQNKLSPTTRLWLITRGAAPINNCLPGLAQTALWGLGKVIALETPELWGGMIDLAPVASSNEAENILKEIFDSEEEQNLSFRDGQRYVLRLLPSESSSKTKITVQSEGTYLITGGLGSLGMMVAKFLVEQGAKHLALLSRRQPNSDVQSSLEELEAKGAKITLAHADVAHYSQLEQVFQQIESTLPPLRGIIHAAGVLDDGMLTGLSWQRFSKVLSPKVAGAWNLHTLSAKLPLDFFVCFSSAAALVGSPGQGNYAAANAFLDGLAHYRQSIGLPGMSLNWGPWAEGGMASRLGVEHQARLREQGVTPITPQQGLQIFEQILNYKSPQIGIIQVDWSIFLAKIKQKTLPALFSELSTQVKSDSENENALSSTIKTELLNQIKSQRLSNKRQDILTEYLQEQVRQVLKLDPSQIPDPQTGFFDLGMDSLIALELKNRLETDLDMMLSSTLIFEFPNIIDLVDYLENELYNKKNSTRKPQEAEIKKQELTFSVQTNFKQFTEKQTPTSIAKKFAEIENMAEDVKNLIAVEASIDDELAKLEHLLDKN
ncbi:MAG: type I polyketide synthase [Moorea sp. SIO4A3]|nr:type I polyketide synthase [Moorena sp. SIO4A3]